MSLSKTQRAGLGLARCDTKPAHITGRNVLLVDLTPTAAIFETAGWKSVLGAWKLLVFAHLIHDLSLILLDLRTALIARTHRI
jgi:hypothetical protein